MKKLSITVSLVYSTILIASLFFYAGNIDVIIGRIRRKVNGTYHNQD